MEDQLKVLSRNRELMSLLLNLAESVNNLAVSVDSTTKRCSEGVVDSILSILDTADKYGDEDLQASLEPLKHKLKVGIAELRTCTQERQHLPFIRQCAVPLGLELLTSLEEYELAALEKAHDTAIENVEALESLYGSQDDDVLARIIEAFKSVLLFLKKAQKRVSSLPQRCIFDGFVDTAAVQKFYLYFLVSVSQLLSKYPSSRHVKILWCFAIRQASLWLSKLRDFACSVSSYDFLDGWMGAFVGKVDEALYHLGQKLGAEFYAAVDAVTSHGMSVCHLCPEADRDKLITAYKQVLECKLDLEKATVRDAGNSMELKCKKMKATLENFEELVNIALVELIVHNYMKPNSCFLKLLQVAKQDPLKRECSVDGFTHLPTNNSAANLSELYKSKADDFCESVDTTYSIAHLAAGCTTDVRSVSKLWEHLRLMEWLDPELVAAVMSLVSSSDEGLSDVLDRMQAAWNFHVQGLFKSLLHLTEPTAFFVCLDASLKRSIACLSDSPLDNQGSASVISVICMRIKAVPDLASVAFEGSTVPEKVEVALKNLRTARRSLQRAVSENRIKVAKVVRGCVNAVYEEITRHLDVVSETPSHIPSCLLTGLTTPMVSKYPVAREKSLDLEITAILKEMELQSCESTNSPATEASPPKDSGGATFPAEEFGHTMSLPKRPARSRVPRAHVNVNYRSNIFTKTGWREALSRSLWCSDRSLCVGNMSSRNWLQNNSTIYALIHEVQLLVKAILEAEEELCSSDSLAQLAYLGHKLASEVANVCSHVKTSMNNRTRLLLGVEKAQNDIEFTARQMQLFLDLGKDKPVANMTVAPFAQNFLLLASEISKALPILCGQSCNGAVMDSPVVVTLLPAHEKLSPEPSTAAFFIIISRFWDIELQVITPCSRLTWTRTRETLLQPDSLGLRLTKILLTWTQLVLKAQFESE
ncbi:uncharacterized protein LOC119175829 isoform X2 [Rhipicephalus microplus]|uniref:uncharacterized protein LOC119175829 isoform X2 n=1 Tax=Rhipicephalus microplus TaxID=6941 RepID=UPI003F6B5EDB